ILETVNYFASYMVTVNDIGCLVPRKSSGGNEQNIFGILTGMDSFFDNAFAAL
ncbi:1805_t:CDS:1, partial [Ambispora leptoticha]